MLRRLLPLALMLFLAGCQGLSGADLAGRVLKGGIVAAQGLFISEADEVRIGLKTTAKVLAQMPEFPNPAVRDYVREVGARMVRHSTRQNLPYAFRVVESPDVNAFAAPGGFIFVTTAALRLMENEAQLAGVLGHEVAHVDRRHSIAGIQKALLAQGVAVAVLEGNSSELAELGANVAATLVLRGFDREAELEADRIGARYAFEENYDARELGSFLGALSRVTGETPAWLVPLGDHPRTADRLDRLSAYFEEEGMAFFEPDLGQERYRREILDRLGPAPSPSPSPEA